FHTEFSISDSLKNVRKSVLIYETIIDFVKENGIRQSMDGKSRWADNIVIERWFRSFKYEEAYLTQYNNIKEARAAIGRYIHTYNFERCHSALDYKTPAECYYPAMLLPYVA
uniref:integrase core domain-containing protein n=1 Tax=Mediterraneibacter gnavus TaxID=33038 RepID=UPI00356922E6